MTIENAFSKRQLRKASYGLCKIPVRTLRVPPDHLDARLLRKTNCTYRNSSEQSVAKKIEYIRIYECTYVCVLYRYIMRRSIQKK